MVFLLIPTVRFQQESLSALNRTGCPLSPRILVRFTQELVSALGRNRCPLWAGFCIFNKFQIKNSVKNAQIALEYSKLEVDKTKIDLCKRIEQAYYNAIGA
jgi:hypothetical protein